MSTGQPDLDKPLADFILCQADGPSQPSYPTQTSMKCQAPATSGPSAIYRSAAISPSQRSWAV